MSGESNTKLYLENYNDLREAAGKINNMTVPDVDALVPLVEGAIKSHSAVIHRIQTVQKLLGLDVSASAE